MICLFDVSRTAFTLFGLSIHWYGVLIVTGVALAILLAMGREKRMHLPKDTVVDLALVCIPAAILGARLYFVAFSWKMYAGQPWWKIFAVWEGGMAVYGGVIAGVLAGWFYAKKKKLSFRKLTDLVAPCIPLGQAIGRWGNFVNQEAHGALVENPAWQFFPAAVNIGGDWFYATFFYESLWCALIVVALLVGEKKRFFRREGDQFLWYVFLYALERGVVEGMRTDSLYLGSMRVSQGLSLAAALIVALIWIRRGTVNWIVPGCILIAAGMSMMNLGIGTFAAALCALAAAIGLYRWEKSDRKRKNRGEIL